MCFPLLESMSAMGRPCTHVVQLMKLCRYVPGVSDAHHTAKLFFHHKGHREHRGKTFKISYHKGHEGFQSSVKNKMRIEHRETTRTGYCPQTLLTTKGTKVTKDFKAESKTRCASSNRETTHTGYCALNQNQFFVELRVLRGEGFLRIMPLCPLCPLGLRKIFLGPFLDGAQRGLDVVNGIGHAEAQIAFAILAEGRA